MKRTLCMTIVMGGLSGILPAQTYTPVRLANPSFEDEPAASKVPARWTNCGSEAESPPDIQPGAFGIELLAAEGHTYLGLVVRDNDTWEAVGQRLTLPLQPDTCYRLELYLGRAQQLYSISRSTYSRANFLTPVSLRVWGSTAQMCGRDQLLAVSEPVKWFGWHRQQLILQPTHPVRYLTLEAWYAPEFGHGVNGHIFVDGLSQLVPAPCPEKPTRNASPTTTATQQKDRELAALQQALRAHVPALAFRADGSLTDDATQAVAALAAIFVQHPSYGLVLAIDEADTRLLKRAHKALLKAFRRAGMKKSRLILQTFRTADAFAFQWTVLRGKVKGRLRRMR